jgi:hypothetical protein
MVFGHGRDVVDAVVTIPSGIAEDNTRSHTIISQSQRIRIV